MEVVGEAVDGGDAVRRVADMRPAVLLVDVSMPGMNGVEVTRAVRAASPDVQVVGVTRHREQQFVNAMLDAGAAGYVLKQSPSSELLHAIRSVASGSEYIDSALPRRRPEVPPRNDAALAPALQTSPDLDAAEWDVLNLLASAHSDGDIANRLSMSPMDVRAIKAHAMDKAGLRTRAQVVEFIRSRRR
jgi:DNA-binding NarL/FixJ family response regulator